MMYAGTAVECAASYLLQLLEAGTLRSRAAEAQD